MTPSDPDILPRMAALIDGWEQAGDRRAVFLRCYMLITSNMLDAIAAGEFRDGPWVDRLLHDFAGYYFAALADYEERRTACAVWRLAHDTCRADADVVQLMLLGVNAHINYDLVLTLVDLLDHEWPDLGDDLRAQRYADYCHVNAIIGRTIDAVQDGLIEPQSPAMALVDRLLGPADEWIISRLITGWREEVWEYATRVMALPPDARRDLIAAVEAETLRRGDAILLRGGPGALRRLP
jgi:hypothetical protein